MKKTLFLLLILAVGIFAACQSAVTDVATTSAPSVSETKFKEITPAEARAVVGENKDAQFIDVRTAEEYQSGHAPQAENFPLDRLAQELGKLDKSKPVYVICQSGARSKKGAEILNEAGFNQVFSIAGGTIAWTTDGFPVEKAALDSPGKLDEKTEKALLAALADERRAFAGYEAVLAKFGDARPFSNVVNAEKRHESFLLPLFEKYGVEVPKNEFTKDKVQVLATLAEACQNGAAGEEANIALYEDFLRFVKEPDIRQVFEHLRDASKNNHLPAFERCAQSGGRGRGRNF